MILVTMKAPTAQGGPTVARIATSYVRMLDS